eukprot:8724014-Pyramimonas_sp.AAC.1
MQQTLARHEAINGRAAEELANLHICVHSFAEVRIASDASEDAHEWAVQRSKVLWCAAHGVTIKQQPTVDEKGVGESQADTPTRFIGTERFTGNGG